MMLSISSTDIQLPSPRPHGLAKYRDLTEMARGGNGVLYAAYDQIVGRTVVLKMLLPEHRLDRGYRRRLLREARVTAQLEHPGTVPVHEIGEDDEYGIYYAMKRISGENFFSVLRQLAKGDEKVANAFPLHRRIEIIRDTCQTLVFAHAAGVIHRDVKPENIWVGNFGEVTLLDWGSAKVWGAPTLDEGRYAVDTTPPSEFSLAPPSETVPTSKVKHEERTYELPTLTPANLLIGTPTYMSPEQIANRDIDERSDVFSAGVCLYEAMAIAEPFRGKDRNETFENICMRQPTPPSERSPQHHIPKEADRIVSKAIAKQTASRYQTMRELITDLDELMLTVRQEESE